MLPRLTGESRDIATGAKFCHIPRKTIKIITELPAGLSSKSLSHFSRISPLAWQSFILKRKVAASATRSVNTVRPWGCRPSVHHTPPCGEDTGCSGLHRNQARVISVEINSLQPHPPQGKCSPGRQPRKTRPRPAERSSQLNSLLKVGHEDSSVNPAAARVRCSERECWKEPLWSSNGD